MGKIYKITHLIWSLNVGGAELLLYNLLAKTDRSVFEPEVIVMKEAGPVGEMIKKLGVPVHAMRSRRGIQIISAFSSLVFKLRNETPDLIHTWTYVPDAAGTISSKLSGKNIPVVWSIHHTAYGSQVLEPIIATGRSLCVKLANSRFAPERIICVSETVKNSHIELGYHDSEKLLVIDNGVDIEKFKPDMEARLSVRRELGIPEDSILIGMVARFHPQKDHKTFIKAAAALSAGGAKVHFLLCGAGIVEKNAELTALINITGIQERFHLLGVRNDMQRIQASLDIGTTSSLGESFSLVIAEAMACGVPCAVLDLENGPLSKIIGDTGIVVLTRDPNALADAFSRLIEIGGEKRCELGAAACERIRKYYSLDITVKKYENLYREIINNKNNMTS